MFISAFQIYVAGVVSIPAFRKWMLERNSKHDHKDRIDILMKKASVILKIFEDKLLALSRRLPVL